jgi:hypothetical protein
MKQLRIDVGNADCSGEGMNWYFNRQLFVQSIRLELVE